MTLLPSDEFGIRGWEGNRYDVNEICAHPHCGKRAAHKHHMWPRSFLRKQPQDWVQTPDGTIVGNLIGLCVEHHENVTGEIGGYKARLSWEGGVMWWVDKEASMAWVNLGPLDPQPPIGDLARNVATGDAVVLTRPQHTHEDGKVCPVCGHHKHVVTPKAKLARRKTKEWTINVPDDAEIGADVLDTWIEDFAIPLGASDWSPRLKRYHVLCAVLAWASVNRSEFIADVAEAAERSTS